MEQKKKANKKFNNCGYRDREGYCHVKDCVPTPIICENCWFYQHYITMSCNVECNELDYDYDEWN